MRLPVFRVMLLALLRDPGALVLAFILPPLVYVVFASIFSGTSGDELRLRVAIYDAANTETTRRLVKEIRDDGTFRGTEREPTSEAELSDFVRQDLADAGLLIRGRSGCRQVRRPNVATADRRGCGQGYGRTDRERADPTHHQ